MTHLLIPSPLWLGVSVCRACIGRSVFDAFGSSTGIMADFGDFEYHHSGVVKVLLSKQQIQCACLGSVLNLPMTEATLIENVVMIGMAGRMLL